MKIYLTTLDSATRDDLLIIEEMLNKDKGPIAFKIVASNTKSGYAERYKDLKKLSLIDIKEINHEIKSENNIFGNYLVLITNKIIEKPAPVTIHGKESWYSAFAFKDIAVHSLGWNDITEQRSYLAIAHQIIENIFQSLSRMNLNSNELLEDVHLQSKGCINDYCRNKNEIHAKILSGFICKYCQDTAREKLEKSKEEFPGGELYILQVKNLLTRIRNRLTDNFEFKVSTNVKIKIDKYGDIKLGDKLLDFGATRIIKHAYLFYLINHNIPMGANDFRTNYKIREKFKNLSNVTGMCKTMAEYDGYTNSMSSYNSKAKKYVLNALPDEGLIDHFFFKSKKDKLEGHHYFIDIQPQNIELDPSLLQYRVN